MKINVCQETAEKYCPILPLVVWICPRGTISCLRVRIKRRYTQSALLFPISSLLVITNPHLTNTESRLLFIPFYMHSRTFHKLMEQKRTFYIIPIIRDLETT